MYARVCACVPCIDVYCLANEFASIQRSLRELQYILNQSKKNSTLLQNKNNVV